MEEYESEIVSEEELTSTETYEEEYEEDEEEW